MCCRCCCLVPRLSTQAFCDFVHLAADHLLNVSTGRNFVCSRREHGLNGGLDFGDGGCRLEVDARQFFVVLVERALAAAAGKCLASDSLQSRGKHHLSSASFHNPIDGVVHSSLERCVSLLVSGHIHALCLANLYFHLSVLHAGSALRRRRLGRRFRLGRRSHRGCFLLLLARDAVAIVSILAFAFEAAKGVGARGEAVAVVVLGFAFVSVVTCAPVADKVDIRHGLVSTSTFERADSIDAFSVGVAVMSAGGAFVNVLACDTVAGISISAVAIETALGIGAGGVLGTVRLLGFAFVDVGAFESVAAEIGVSHRPCPALAVVGANDVCAFGVLVAFVASVGAFVAVCTCDTVTLQPTLTRASVSANRVRACCQLVAVVPPRLAFVNVLACEAVALEVFEVGEARSAAASEGAGQVCAFGIGIAVVAAVGAFVNVDTCDTVAGESRVASAFEPAYVVHASRIVRAVVRH